MRIFIDCEWNDYGGELISMALISESGKEFYEVLDCQHPTEWVTKNVIFKLNKSPIRHEEFIQKLFKFLSEFDSIHVIADWPEDISWFCKLLITGAGTRLDTPPLTMEIVRIDTVSDYPHNALSDAKALRAALV